MKHSATRQLLILRHGKARKDLPVNDRDRPLAEEGHDDLVQVAAEAVAADFLPQLVLCSPALRARETAALFLAAAHADAELLFDEGIYSGGVDAVLTLIRAVPEKVRRLMVVGHNPDLEDLVRRLCGVRKTGLDMHPGALVVFAIAGAWSDISCKTAIFKKRMDPRA